MYLKYYKIKVIRICITLYANYGFGNKNVSNMPILVHICIKSYLICSNSRNYLLYKPIHAGMKYTM